MAVSDSVATTETTTGDARSPRVSSFAGFLLRFLVVGIITGTIMAVSNVNIGAVGQGLALSLVGVSVYMTFRVLNFPDLSVDGSYPIGGAVAATLIATYGIAAEWTLLASFMAGALTGMVTAMIHVMFKIEGLLASIIVATGAYTITLRTMGTSNIPLLNERTILTPYEPGMREFVINVLGPEARRQSNNMVEVVVFLVVVAVVMGLLNWFMHTEIGLTLRASGRNKQMVRALGVNDKVMVVLGLMISNGLAGLAGGLAVQQLGFADVQMGIGMIIRGLAAVMIGEVLLRPKSVGQAIVAAGAGMVIFDVSRAWVFAALDLQASDVRLVSSLVVLLALAAPNISQRWKAWRQRQDRKQREAA